MGNPWFKKKCECCNNQLRSWSDLGIASFQSKEHEDGFDEKEFKELTVHRNICKRCSAILGYEEDGGCDEHASGYGTIGSVVYL